MAELVPQSLEVLLRRMAFELSSGACFDLPSRKFYRPTSGFDLSAHFHGERAGNALGPAAGPQSQLAQNLVLCYLAGARVFELKTVQVNDTLVLPRPCIDATNVGYNVEWSQELRLSQSLEEYTKAWVLLHALRHADLGLGLSTPSGEFLFDLSVGYDLAGIRSPAVRRFLDGMTDAGPAIDALFAGWPRDLLAWRPPREAVPNRISSCVTLSTFHGCPAEEIERICEHLLDEVGLHLVVKLNPTLMGYEQVRALINDQLGYAEVRPHRESFEKDLQWTEALSLVSRLQAKALARGLTLGAKFSNTLVVENHRSFFPATEKLMYLSGQPLHVLSFELCRAFREAYGAPLPLSFSAGVDARNYPDCVAAGLVPITTCTDLLRPGGFGRLPQYLLNLIARMKERKVASVADFILAESGRSERVATVSPEALHPLLERAARDNHAAAAARTLADPRYSAAQNSAVPRRLGTRLWLFDCVSCDKCVQVCPNDANFTLTLPAELTAEVRLPDLVVRGGVAVEEGERIFALSDTHQLGNYAPFCNECGNCDVFCPEEGGPYLIKPRFFASAGQLAKDPAHLDGFAVERTQDEDRLVGRHQGQALSLTLDRARSRACFDDGQATVKLSYPQFAWEEAEVRQGAPEGHVIRLDRARAMAALLHGVLAEGAVSPVSAPYLPPRPPSLVSRGEADARP